MKKKTGAEHLVDVVNEWIDENEASREGFCVFVDKNENGENFMTRTISGGSRLISAITLLMEQSEAARDTIMLAAKAFVYRKYHKDITLN